MFIAQLITVALVHLLAVISPGPDFAIVTRNSLVHSRKIAVYTSLGIALGISVHVAYSILGISLIISKSILLFNIIKYIGATYLIYIGLKSLLSKQAPETSKQIEGAQNKKSVSISGAIWTGFLTNVLNPKATLFFLALFTQVIHEATPKIIQILYGVEMMTITFIWFSAVSILFSNSLIKSKITRVQSKIEKISGAVLIALGIKVALTNNK